MERKRDITNHKESLQGYLKIIKEYRWMIAYLAVIIIIIEILRLAPKYLLGYIVDQGALFTSGDIAQSVLIYSFWIAFYVFVTVTVLRIIFTYIREVKSMVLFIEMTRNVKKKFFNHLISLDAEFHNTTKTGSIISRLSRGSNAVQGLSETFLFMIFPVIVQLIIIAISLAYFSILPAIAFVITSVVFVTYSIWLQQKQKEDKLLYNNAEDREKGIMSDYFLNVESIKYFGKDKKIKQSYDKITHETKAAEYKYLMWFRFLSSGQQIILGIGTIFVLLFPLLDFIDGTISIGTISFIYTAYLGYIGAVFAFTSGIRSYYRNMADLESMFEYDKVKNNIKDKKDATDIKIRKGNIAFKDVTFTYAKGEKVLKNFNLDIPCKKKIALIGHSGSGKTTLVKLLYRLHDVEKGEITIDDINIADVKQESLRSEMAIVSQEPILFDDTIYNNIKFSKPGATRKEVEKAIKFAQLDKVIQKLPKKEHTIVGERGVKLSTGQKQRVSIARALLANKKILVLDEATSALDSETESEIQKDLEKLMKDRTAIIIAHRLSTIMNADIIVVLKDGKIMQMGTHKELIKKGGEYKRLWKYQKGGYIEDNPR